jgi:hypothetical protein
MSNIGRVRIWGIPSPLTVRPHGTSLTDTGRMVCGRGHCSSRAPSDTYGLRPKTVRFPRSGAMSHAKHVRLRVLGHQAAPPARERRDGHRPEAPGPPSRHKRSGAAARRMHCRVRHSQHGPQKWNVNQAQYVRLSAKTEGSAPRRIGRTRRHTLRCCSTQRSPDHRVIPTSGSSLSLDLGLTRP